MCSFLSYWKSLYACNIACILRVCDRDEELKQIVDRHMHNRQNKNNINSNIQTLLPNTYKKADETTHSIFAMKTNVRMWIRRKFPSHSLPLMCLFSFTPDNSKQCISVMSLKTVGYSNESMLVCGGHTYINLSCLYACLVVHVLICGALHDFACQLFHHSEQFSESVNTN